ncbi:MAG: efflux transporter outer membrane subunit [Planctomycetes bacterium]|nr:efflux transporter outer membrane subunit [Planctomycetota bacterium]
MKRFPVLSAVLLAGCSVGPSYEPPAIETPAQFSSGGADCGDISEWWKALGDPVLDSLVLRAIEGNFDLKRAQAALKEGRALRGSAIADNLPEVDASASLKAKGVSRNSLQGRQPGATHNYDLYQTGFDASWEVDIWGGKRRALEEADAMLGVTTEELHAVLTSLCAEVARTYIALRGTQRQLQVAADGLKGQQEIYNLTKMRFDAGMASDLDVARAEAEVAILTARIPSLRVAESRARHALAALLGLWPGVLDAELAEVRPIPVPPKLTPAGLPADLLARRPDLRRAERQLAVATADIGIKVDAMLPHVSLLGLAGLESIGSQLLFKSTSAYWSFGPSISWRVFSLPQLYCEVKAADARAEQALHAYHGAVVGALREVEDALAETESEDARRTALSNAVAATGRAVGQAKDLYKQGLISLLDVLETDKAWLNALNDLAQSDAAVATNRVALYKALGGGWKMEEEGK